MVTTVPISHNVQVLTHNTTRNGPRAGDGPEPDTKPNDLGQRPEPEPEAEPAAGPGANPKPVRSPKPHLSHHPTRTRTLDRELMSWAKAPCLSYTIFILAPASLTRFPT